MIWPLETSLALHCIDQPHVGLCFWAMVRLVSWAIVVCGAVTNTVAAAPSAAAAVADDCTALLHNIMLHARTTHGKWTRTVSTTTDRQSYSTRTNMKLNCA